VDELDIINKILNPIAEPGSLKNDAYILKNLAITKDILIEGGHFLKNADPYKLAKKAVRANLSDIASVGADPIGYFLGINIPEQNNNKLWLENFAKGLDSDNKKYNISILGGDTTTYKKGSLVISITMLGRVSSGYLTRSGAKSKDFVCISGVIGDAYFGLKSYRGEIENNEYFKEKYYLPTPQIELGKKLVRKASSCIDLSDGLLDSIKHIEKNSSVKIEIDVKKIPFSDQGAVLLKNDKNTLNKILSFGDDYQLLFTIKESLIKDLAIQHKITVIGKVL